MKEETLSSKIRTLDSVYSKHNHLRVEDVKDFIQTCTDLSCERCKRLIKERAGDDLIHSQGSQKGSKTPDKSVISDNLVSSASGSDKTDCTNSIKLNNGGNINEKIHRKRT